MTGCGLVVDVLTLLGLGVVGFVLGWLFYKIGRFVQRCNNISREFKHVENKVWNAYYLNPDWPGYRQFEDIKNRLNAIERGQSTELQFRENVWREFEKCQRKRKP